MKKYLLMMMAMIAMAGTALFSACDNDDDPKKEEGDKPQPSETTKGAFTYYVMLNQEALDYCQVTFDLSTNAGETFTFDVSTAERITYDKLDEQGKSGYQTIYDLLVKNGVKDAFFVKHTFNEQEKPAKLTVASHFALKDGVTLTKEAYTFLVSPFVSFDGIECSNISYELEVFTEKMAEYLQYKNEVMSGTYEAK